MRLELHVYHHFDVIPVSEGSAAVLAAISDLKETTMALSAKLQAAVDAANAAVADEDNKLDQVLAALKAQADVAAAAVATALAKVGVEEDAAAELIDSARVSVQEHIDAVIGALPPGPVPAPPPPPVVDPLTITTIALPDAVTGQPYTGSIAFAGGTAPYSVSNAPVVDNGVTVGTDGSVSGTPTADADSTFSLSVSDSGTPPQTVGGAVTLHSATAAPVVSQQ